MGSSLGNLNMCCDLAESVGSIDSELIARKRNEFPSANISFRGRTGDPIIMGFTAGQTHTSLVKQTWRILPKTQRQIHYEIPSETSSLEYIITIQCHSASLFLESPM